MKIVVYSQDGKKANEAELPKEIFECDWQPDVVARAYLRQLTNARRPVAHTMTKAEVSGTNKKPFKQKGTGRARQGSLTNPHMVGGGVAFGPRKERNFEIKLPKKQSRLALFAVLSAKAKENKIFGLDKYEGEVKTKDFGAMLKKMPIDRDVLVVIAEKDPVIQRSSRNLENVKTILAGYLNIKDLVTYNQVMLVGDSLKKITDVFLS